MLKTCNTTGLRQCICGFVLHHALAQCIALTGRTPLHDRNKKTVKAGACVTAGLPSLLCHIIHITGTTVQHAPNHPTEAHLGCTNAALPNRHKHHDSVPKPRPRCALPANWSGQQALRASGQPQQHWSLQQHHRYICRLCDKQHGT